MMAHGCACDEEREDRRFRVMMRCVLGVVCV